MAGGVLAEAAGRWVATLLILGFAALCYWLNDRTVSPAAVAFDYRSVVRERQLWRVVTGACAHYSPVHLLFNVATLWSVGEQEAAMGHILPRGSGPSFTQSMLMLWWLSAAGHVALCALLATLWGGELRCAPSACDPDQPSVGFSGVLFAWMSWRAALDPLGARVVYFGYAVPSAVGVLLSVLLIQLLVPRASLLGHAGGVLGGCALAALTAVAGPRHPWLWWAAALLPGAAVALSAAPPISWRGALGAARRMRFTPVQRATGSDPDDSEAPAPSAGAAAGAAAVPGGDGAPAGQDRQPQPHPAAAAAAEAAMLRAAAAASRGRGAGGRGAPGSDAGEEAAAGDGREELLLRAREALRAGGVSEPFGLPLLSAPQLRQYIKRVSAQAPGTPAPAVPEERAAA